MLVISFLSVGAIVAGVPLAWFNDRKEQENVFSFVGGGTHPDSPGPVDIQLAEPHWSYDTQFSNYKDKDGNDYVPSRFEGPTDPDFKALYDAGDKDSDKWGIKKAEDYAYHTRIPKNPTIRAIGQLPTFVGVKISGADNNNLNMAELDLIYTIDYSSDWQLVHKDENARYYVYPQVLIPEDAPDKYGTGIDTTPPVFTNVFVKDKTAANGNVAVFDKISVPNPANSHILVTAYSVQAINDEAGTAWDAKAAMFAEFGQAAVSTENPNATDWTEAKKEITTP